MPSTDAFTDFMDAAREAARRAAAVLQQWRSRFSVREKGRADLVTEADVASQRTICEFLSARFPGHAFLGEEESADKNRPGPDAPPTWIIDPIDGTTNYVHDVPMYCISLGLMVASELVVGVVYDPRQQEMFRAAKGHGAWLNGRRLQTSQATRLEESLIATGFPPDLKGQEKTLDWWRYFSFRTRSLRRTGSTAINMAYVAAGRFDAYWGFDNHAWDVAGAAVLIQEAGGAMSRTDGSPFDAFAPDSVVSNGPLQALLLEHLRKGP
jgi:myo-inositol-1(or 4)-monophosphatase